MSIHRLIPYESSHTTVDVLSDCPYEGNCFAAVLAMAHEERAVALARVSLEGILDGPVTVGTAAYCPRDCLTSPNGIPAPENSEISVSIRQAMTE